MSKQNPLRLFLSTLLAILLLILSNCAPAYAQPVSPANERARIVAEASESVTRGLTNACANLLEAFKASENHITALENELDKSRKVNAALTEKVSLLERALALRTEEADAWRRALEAQKAAIDRLTELAAKQDERIAKLEKSRSRRGKLGIALGVAGFVAGVLLK